MLAPLGTAARPNEPSAKAHVDLDGRIAAAVENLPGVNINNRAHRNSLLAWDRTVVGQREVPIVPQSSPIGYG